MPNFDTGLMSIKFTSVVLMQSTNIYVHVDRDQNHYVIGRASHPCTNSKQLHLFLLLIKEPKTDKDDDNCKKVNDMLNNPPTPGSTRGGGFGEIGRASCRERV